MKIGYRIMRYAGAPSSIAEVDFAVVVLGPVTATVRALGLDREGNVDVTPFERLAGVSAADAWTYREWINWLRDLVGDEPLESVRPTLDDLATRSARIQASTEEFFEVSEHQNQDIERIADRLFAEFVRKASGSE